MAKEYWAATERKRDKHQDDRPQTWTEPRTVKPADLLAQRALLQWAVLYHRGGQGQLLQRCRL
ncbi:hypothetical protein [Mumia zhuanghuii]|uniref:Uncharacterized protein n=1 Tax=Mumia zhuanghuii TaxID=2585211 RepID=A0A5C4LV57_9ACTN|nr:hypothetical protein [Mumia zhuanghuii]TNC21775.1 hypothetical protein FHE65_36330 [Mumia zhuanghuii]